MKSIKGFTLVELMVVLGILAMLMAAMSVSLSGAKRRAMTAKAESEVKVISQAILAYEQYDSNHELQTMENQEANASSLGFLIGSGTADSGGQMPTLLMAQLTSGGAMLDPWDTPYRVSIKSGSASVKYTSGMGSLQSAYYLPNFYRLSAEERGGKEGE